MKQEVKYFKCSHCGNIVEMIINAGVPVLCCGEKMQELHANTTDAAVEKHVPSVMIEGQVVNVVIGSVEHPMTTEHHIAWIEIVTDKTTQRTMLSSEGAPRATFVLPEGDKLIAVYEYCNLHGLWKSEI